jgi:succinyl-diaminopimelate desuccinylase
LTQRRAETDAGFEKLLGTIWGGIDREELVRLTQELVRIPSVYRPEDPAGNEEAAARAVAEYLEGAGFEVRTEEVSPGRPNVWAVWEGDLPGKTLLFEAHTDVVTEGAAEDWEHPPFAAERAGGRVYGRGACDTKGNLAAAILAVRTIKDSGLPFPGKLVLCHPGRRGGDDGRDQGFRPGRARRRGGRGRDLRA